MTPDSLAKVHKAAFISERPWSAAEFESLLAGEHCHLFTQVGGFALSRTLVGETELLTLAVDPSVQRQGLGYALVQEWLKWAGSQASLAFLEVAADNQAALSLYHKFGFTQAGLRRNYYARNDGKKADAVLMQRDLTMGQATP